MKKKSRTLSLLTPEGERFINEKPSVPWNIYPRPHLVRDSFFCLNGEWGLDVKSGDSLSYSGKVLVPFVPESALSGVEKRFSRGSVLFYSKRFAFSKPEGDQRVILHFGAVDQIARVRMNSFELGEHAGGYGSFSFDVTDVIREENLIEVEVRDELEKMILPYGKQCEKRGGMWYTPISGIWQSVWIECVPREYIKEISFRTDAHGADLEIAFEGCACDGSVKVSLGDLKRSFEIKDGSARIEIDEPLFWSPEDPNLYDVEIIVGEDRVRSYFALRSLEIREGKSKKRLCLNGSPYFFHGLLDQGYFSDGIFLPASSHGYERDITEAKRLGFNMLRKHIKLEPEIFYHLCDKLGIVVFQDMVNNSDYSFLRDTALPTVGIKKLNDKRLHRDKSTREAFLCAMDETVRRLSFHPSVCYWTIFNEGWGQFDHASAYKRLRKLDDSRFIDSVSGWFLPHKAEELRSDVESLHIYFKPVTLKSLYTDKPAVLSEFGGYSYKIEGHSFNLDNNYGYRTFTDGREFEDALEKLYLCEVLPAVENGLCAAVYTQLSDVEDETNGLMTYDRQMTKVSVERMKKIAEALYLACE